MTPRPEELYGSPNALAPLYSSFRVAERLLLIDSNSLIYRGFFAVPPVGAGVTPGVAAPTVKLCSPEVVRAPQELPEATRT